MNRIEKKRVIKYLSFAQLLGLVMPFYANQLDRIEYKENRILQETTEILNLLNPVVNPIVVGEFDVVIVGLGTSGSVIANRLSTAHPELTFCVLEAGADDTRVPPELPISDETVRYPFMETSNSFWPVYERKGLFTWGDELNQGFHQFSWQNLERDTSDSRSVYYARGQAWGGSTVHAQVYLRGDVTDYNKWVALGLTEWNPTAMRAAYKKAENRSQTNTKGSNYFSSALNDGVAGNFNSINYNNSGPVTIANLLSPTTYVGGNDIGFVDPLTQALIEVGDSLPGGFNTMNGGILRDGDSILYESLPVVIATPISDQDQLGTLFSSLNNYNDGGIAYPPGTAFGLSGVISDFQRVLAASAYIYPIQDTNTNLTIRSKSFATQITFDNLNNANGVVFLEGTNLLSSGMNPNVETAGYGGTPQDAELNAIKAKKNGYKKVVARKEVIVCGGTFNSPHLLLVSGIGPRAQLESFGIKVIADRPGVGLHLKDHAEADHYWSYDNLHINAFDSQAGFNGWWVGFPTVRCKSDPSRPDYDYHIHMLTGADFGINGGGVVNWTDGRINIRKVGPPSYVHNRLNEELILPCERDFTSQGWALLEQQKDEVGEGFVALRSADATIAPKIVMNHLNDPADVDSFVSAFQNFLWPLVEGLKKKDYILQVSGAFPNTVPSTVHQGFGSMFLEWLWPTEDMFLDTNILGLNPLSTTIASTTVVVTQINHGLGAPGFQTHVRLEGAPASVNGIPGTEINQLQYVTVIDADHYSFSSITPASSTGTGGGAFMDSKTFNRDNYIAFAEKYCWGHHASGTCKMGLASDPLAVVDQHCRVYGVNGLRVVDCSIAAVIQSANTQTAAYAYGERASELILSDWA